MLEKFARYPLTFGPSYIHPLERLSAYLGNVVRLYAKREDCNSGLAFGGNKLRKLEFIFPDAIAGIASTSARRTSSILIAFPVSVCGDRYVSRRRNRASGRFPHRLHGSSLTAPG